MEFFTASPWPEMPPPLPLAMLKSPPVVSGPRNAELPETVLLLMVRTPAGLEMPAPFPPTTLPSGVWLPLTVLLIRKSKPPLVPLPLVGANIALHKG